MFFNYLISFILTILIEIAVARIFFYERYVVLLVLLINAITHPLFNLTLYILKYDFSWQISWGQILLFEIGIFALEAGLINFAGFSKTKAVKLSFFANGASLATGYLLIKFKLLFLFL